VTNHPNRAKAKERAVVVTTQHRGVFFGYATDTDAEIIKLSKARNCLSWSADVKGFMGLAATGPNKSCRVGPAVDGELGRLRQEIAQTQKTLADFEANKTSQAAAESQELVRLRKDNEDLLRLRNEVRQLRNELQRSVARLIRTRGMRSARPVSVTIR